MRLSLLAISLAVGIVLVEPGLAWEILPWTAILATFGFIGSAARARTGPGPVSD